MTHFTKQFKLNKRTWSEADFDNMQWHDNPIHAFTFNDDFQFLLDIDYLFEWTLKEQKYFFWISPCTLIFENVYDLKVDIGPTSTGFKIDFLARNNPQKPKNSAHINRDTEFDWTIEMWTGKITFKSVGFKQYVRKLPILLGTQKLTLEERGGISFDAYIG